MDDLKIAIVQTSLFWEDVAANLAMLEEKIWQISETVDLIILPEMFNTGFSINAKKIAETANGHTTKWMKQMVSQTKAALCGSFAIQENGLFYNRFHFVDPDLKVYAYTKNHTFSMANEHIIYQSGNSKTIIKYKKWNINLKICYDLRFPQTSVNQIVDGEYMYDLLIYVANWPQTRIEAWTHLLEARAIENASYAIGVNRTGMDNNNLVYNGQSAVCFPIASQNYYLGNLDETKIIILSAKNLLEYRNNFPFLIDAK